MSMDVNPSRLDYPATPMFTFYTKNISGSLSVVLGIAAGFASRNTPSVYGGERFRHFYGMLDTAAPLAMVT